MSVEDEVSMGDPAPAKKPDEPHDKPELSLSEEELDQKRAREEFAEATKNFDLKAWIEGVRSARTTVRIYARADLDVHIQRVAAELAEAQQLGLVSLVKERQRKLKALRQQYFAASLDIVLEERSKEWQARKMRELQDAGVTDQKALTLGIVAAQIVDPEGAFTGDDLLELAEVIPSQVRRLVDAWGQISGVSQDALPVF